MIISNIDINGHVFHLAGTPFSSLNFLLLLASCYFSVNNIQVGGVVQDTSFLRKTLCKISDIN